MNISAVILAGGESRRMGRDKAWVELAGRPLIARAVSVVREAGITEVYVSGHSKVDYSSLGLPILLDRESNLGPLGGIERGLSEAGASLLLVLAVDLPRMTSAFLRRLTEACGTDCGVIPELNGALEPLAAIYPGRCHAIVRDCLRKGNKSARYFAEASVNQGAIRKFQVSRDEVVVFENWNFPADAGSCQVA